MRVRVLGVLVAMCAWVAIAAAQDAGAPAVEAPAALVDGGAPAVVDAGDAPALDAAVGPAAVAPAPRGPAIDDDYDGEVPPEYQPVRRSQTGALRSGIAGILLLAAILWVMVRSQGSATGAGGWSTYYLVWLVVPMVIAVVSFHPWVLVIGAIGLVARPWLPDPVQYLRHAARARALEAQVRANPANLVARRDLAEIWLAKRRPKRALAHLEIARQREPEDLELRLLEAQSHAQAGRHEQAATALLAIVAREPKFRYGDAALAAADAQIAQGKWAEAADALALVKKANSSSVEAHVKLAKVKVRRGDAAGAAAERRAARQLYGELPRFQRKRQRYWYLRALVGL